ncbi:MAG: hypothetical protein PHE75_03950, partial [Candidatus Cloacimonas acidaminovorans]|nr:hypothetical protein [Candidatus Cloacimonas acidaminovorans]
QYRLLEAEEVKRTFSSYPHSVKNNRSSRKNTVTLEPLLKNPLLCQIPICFWAILLYNSNYNLLP